MRQFVKDIIADLESKPERWRQGFYTWERDDGIAIWRANMPILDIGLHRPVEISFTLVEKFKVWRAFRKWANTRALDFIVKGARK